MRHRFHSEQWLSYPVEQVFRFFGDPANLPRLMPDWQQARIDRATLVPPPIGYSNTSETPMAGRGSRILLSFRPVPLLPIRLCWDAEIDEFSWNDHFCDLQLTGPFTYWRHCHSVTFENRDGVEGTLLRDDLSYEVPLGPLGSFANWIAVSGQIRSAFAFRHRRTIELLRSAEAGETKA